MNVMETLADLLDTDVDRARVVWRDGKPMARHKQRGHQCGWLENKIEDK